MANTLRVKPALRWVHRWIGLTLGLILVVVSLSGSLLLFQEQFFRWAHGELIPPDLSQEAGSLDQWVASAKQAMPPGFYGPIALVAPHVDHNLTDAGMVIYLNPEQAGFLKEGYAAAFVEPATGKLVGTLDVDHSPAYAPLALHAALWAGERGEVLVAAMGIGTLIFLPLGLYLWWPAPRKLLSKLSLRPWRATLTHARSLHDWTGAWTVIVLFVLSGTGIYMGHHEWFDSVLTATVGPEPGPPAQEPATCAGPIGLDEVMRRGGELVPGGQWILAQPAEDDSMRHWRFTFKTPGSVRQQTQVLADLQCGGVWVESTPATRSARESSELWLMTLHDGRALGEFGRILITVIGIVPLVMLWSGMRMWLHRRGWLKRPASMASATMGTDPSREAVRSSSPHT